MDAGLPLPRPVPPGVSRRTRLDVLLLVLAVALAPLGLLGTDSLMLALAAVLAAGTALATVRWPQVALPALVVLLGLQLPVLALSLRAGLPAEMVRAAGFLKDVVVVGIVLAGLKAVVAQRQRFDLLDRVALVYLAVFGVYFVLGAVVPRVFGDVFARSPDSPFLQLLALRAHAAGVALLLAVRSLEVSGRTRAWVVRAVVAVSVVLAVGALVEAARPTSWGRFATDWVQWPAYQEQVFGIVLEDVVVQTEVAGRLLVRAGSLLFDYLQLGFFLLPAFAVGLVAVSRTGRVTGWLLTALTGAAILATVTRSAILAAAVLLVTAGMTVPRGWDRTRLVALAMAAVAGVLAVAVPTGLAARLGAAVSGTDESTQEHVEGLVEGTSVATDNPLGIGLATTAEVAPRSDTVAVFSENSYLDVAVQTGVAGLVPFVVFIGVLLVRLVRRRPRGTLEVTAVTSVAGLAVGGLFLHVWTMIETTWIVFALAGLALPRETR